MKTQTLIEQKEDYPKVEDLETVYLIHAAMAEDPLIEELGGVVGYKQGGIGAVPDVECVYGVLFGCGIVQQPEGLSKSRFNLFGLVIPFCAFNPVLSPNFV